MSISRQLVLNAIDSIAVGASVAVVLGTAIKALNAGEKGPKVPSPVKRDDAEKNDLSRTPMPF